MGRKTKVREVISSTLGRGKQRWLIVWLIFIVSAVSYLDRTNISIAAQQIRGEFGISQVQLGTVLTAFILGYALTQPIAGRLADRFGGRRVIAWGIVWWSVLTVLTACVSPDFAGSFIVLIAVRALLGIGESVVYPASNRLVANWIPTHERGLANGLIFAGVGFGAGVAPPLVTFIMISHGWRSAFWVSAALGMVVLVVWLWLARENPATHERIGAAERDYIEASTSQTSRQTDEVAFATPLSWREILRNRHMGLLTLAYFCFGYTAFIFFTWFFTYLSTVKNLDLKSSGWYGMLPFLAMAAACIFGGWFSDRLTKTRGKRVGRCMPAAFGMALAGICVALATQVSDARFAAIVLAAGSGALYLSQSAFWTLSADYGRSSAGAVSGVMNMGCQLGGAAVAQVTPIIAEAFGWTSSFLVAAAAAVIGAVCWLLIDPATTLRAPAPATAIA
jgi:ACS family glucarate transporter-like MFS transporter